MACGVGPVWAVSVHLRHVVAHASRSWSRCLATASWNLVSANQCADRVSVVKAARHLVFALGARLEARQAVTDAVIEALVVAGLEVQIVKMRVATPVSSVQRVVTDQAKAAATGRDSCSARISNTRPACCGRSTRKCERQVGVPPWRWKVDS